MKINYAIGAFLCMLGCYACSSPKTEVKSPDGHIKMALTVDDNGKPLYNVLVGDSLLIENSTLGFTEKNGIDLGGGFQIKNTTFDSKDETWTQPWGENKTNRNHYNEMAVNLVNKDQVELTLRFRVFDDGVGFRYEYNVPAADSLLITDELTTFRFRQDGTSWSIPASAETYELLYAQRPISEVETANTPFTFKTADGVYGSIHEAALYDFSEMTLKQAGNYTLKAELAPWPDGVKVRKGNHFTTSWRTIQIVPDAVSLINSAMILNLNEPSKIETTDWIRPMKYVGVWWGMHLGVETWKMDERHGATTVNAKKYIDFAAANQIEGVLFEGWNEGKAGVVCKTLTLRNRMLTLTLMKWFVMQRKKELKLSAITRPEGIFPTMSARWIMLCNGTQTTVSMSLRQDMRELSRMVIFITANMGSTTIRKWWKQLPVTK